MKIGTIKIKETENLEVVLQYSEYGVMVHVPRVEKIKLKEAKAILEELLEFLGAVGYTHLYAKPTNPRLEKVLEYLGFEKEIINGVEVWAIPSQWSR